MTERTEGTGPTDRAGRRDRRRETGSFRGRPRSSPANMLVLTVIGILSVTAAASVLMGGGLEDTTPHGQLLSSLDQVAEAQEAHYAREGSFARWLATLDIEPSGENRLTVLWADGSGWEAVAAHPVGLSCVQRGSVRDGRPQRERPLCYTDG